MVSFLIVRSFCARSIDCRDKGYSSHQCRVGAEGCFDLVYAVSSGWALEVQAAAEAKQKEKKDAEAAASKTATQGPSKGDSKDQKDGKESKDKGSKAPTLNAAIGFSKGNNYEDFAFAMDVRDGKLYCSSDDFVNPSFKVSDTFQPGDVLGCGYNSETKEIFFTRNDKVLGVAFKNVPVAAYYAACGFRPTNQQKVSFNFGHEPFVFKGSAQQQAALADAARPDLVLDAYRGPKKLDSNFEGLVQPKPSDVAMTCKGVGSHFIINSSAPLIQPDGKVSPSCCWLCLLIRCSLSCSLVAHTRSAWPTSKPRSSSVA